MRDVIRYPDGGWAELVGNDLALDLVNTVSWRRDPERRVDRLADVAALLHWCGVAAVLDPQTRRRLARQAEGDPAAGATALERVRELRELLYDVLLPLAVGDQPQLPAVRGLHALLLDSLRRVEVVSLLPLEWAADPGDLGDLPDRFAVHAWRLLERGDVDRLRECQGAGCGWLFLDRSRNGARIWCSSNDCGNRSRVRRHYQRQHGPRDESVAPE
ncbi:CGNR zinc finger domain-containing protein [Nocardioides sp.]|uniref:CGNR zinc finger domain-containing protein n=1 Tax=Nocardioides sp. TaxID=35761 RepID=UPI002ED65E4F